MAAPILWTPGKNAFSLPRKPMSIKFRVLGGGGYFGFGGGGGSADFNFMGARIFLSCIGAEEKGMLGWYPTGQAEESKPAAAQGGVSEGSRPTSQKEPKTSLLETLRVTNILLFDSGDSVWLILWGRQGPSETPSKTRLETLLLTFCAGPGFDSCPWPAGSLMLGLTHTIPQWQHGTCVVLRHF